jgi:hypothetical protein
MSSRFNQIDSHHTLDSRPISRSRIARISTLCKLLRPNASLQVEWVLESYYGHLKKSNVGQLLRTGQVQVYTDEPDFGALAALRPRSIGNLWFPGRCAFGVTVADATRR